MELQNIAFLGVAIATLILALGELLKNQTKEKYIEEGYSWKGVLFWSNLLSIPLGLITAFVVMNHPKLEELNLHVIPFAVTIVAYITVQSYKTDMKILMINRNILRVAYLSMYVATVYNLISNDLFRANVLPVGLFTVLIGILFIFSSIGASDIRAIAVALPFVVSIGGFDAIIMFIYTLIAVAIGMEVRNRYRDRKRWKKFKEDNYEAYKGMSKILFYKLARDMIRKEKTEAELATPVGPFMIAPFLIYLLIYPVFLT